MNKQAIRDALIHTLKVKTKLVSNDGTKLIDGATKAATFAGGVTGNVTGDVTGNVVGGVKHPVVLVTADGAIAVPAVSTSYHITKAGAAAMTLVDPTAVTHDGVRLTFFSETAFAHTLSNAAGSGFNAAGAGADVGTFAAAAANQIEIEARNGKWWVLRNVGVTLA